MGTNGKKLATAVFAIAAGICAGTVQAYEPTNDAETRLVAWLEEFGCALPQKEFMGRALSAEGLAPSDLMAARRAMTQAGSLSRDGQNLRLTTGAACGSSAVADAAPASSFEDTPKGASLAMVAAMERADCTITEAMAIEIGTQYGLSASSVDNAFDLLEDDGSIVIADDRNSARLVKGDICAGAARSRAAEYEPQSDAERTVIAMFEENGCSLTEEQLPALGERYGIEKKAFRTAGRALMKAGVFSESGGTVTLLDGACASGETAAEAPATDDKRATVVRVFEENDCTLTSDQADTLFEAAGLSLDEDRALVRGMISAGDITVNRATREATLVIGATCTGGTEPVRAMDERGLIIEVFERNDCRMTEEMAMEQFPAVGLDLERDENVVEAMFEAGELIEGDDNTARLVIGERCKAEQNALKDIVIEAFASNECTLTENSFEAALEGKGVDIDEAGELVEAMMETGEVSYDKSTKQARLTIGETCTQ